MNNFNELKKFEITAACDQEVLTYFVGNTLLRDQLNTSISLPQYTQHINTVFVIFQAFNPSGCRKTEEYQIYHRKTNVLELYLVLNYNKLQQSDSKQALQLMAETYLHGINNFLLKRKDFDGKRFYNDVQKLFEPILKE